MVTQPYIRHAKEPKVRSPVSGPYIKDSRNANWRESQQGGTCINTSKTPYIPYSVVYQKSHPWSNIYNMCTTRQDLKLKDAEANMYQRESQLFLLGFPNEADCRCTTHKYTLFSLRSRCLRGVNNTTRAPANLAGTWGLWGKRSLGCLRGASPLNTCRLAEADIHTTVQH
jgi:hypothetical protein